MELNRRRQPFQISYFQCSNAHGLNIPINGGSATDAVAVSIEDFSQSAANWLPQGNRGLTEKPR